jgi:tetratricopeptide (TPR) repeat protein
MLIHGGMHEDAVATLERAIAASGDRYSCNLRIAEIYRAMQRWSDALEAIERAATADPARLDAYELALDVALESGDSHRILNACRALIKIDPVNLSAHNALGTLYMRMGDTDAAMRAANTLIRLEPDNTSHHFKKALLSQHKGEIALAVQEFSLVVHLAPEGPHSEAAREALETLDALQLNQIATLAMDDMVFRTKLERNPQDAVMERGFYLSDTGTQVLSELCAQSLGSLPTPLRTSMYN